MTDDEGYTAKALVDLAMDGHFCVREEIGRAIRAIYRLAGTAGRERMNQLPDLRAYASEAEIDAWQAKLLVVLADTEASASARDAAAKQDPGEPTLWELP